MLAGILKSPRFTFFVWLLAAAGVTCFALPAVAKAYWTNERRDFQQEWLSARNYLHGFPIYETPATALARYADGPGPGGLRLVVNAHPPTSILLGLPFALMSYSTAFLSWNLFSLMLLIASLFIMARALKMKWNATTLPRAYILALICGPLNEQIYEGQLNLVLLVLIVAGWSADRSDRQITGGALVGTAAAIKIVPAFLLLYFVLQRRWRAVASGVIAILFLTLLTSAILGASAYSDYVKTGLGTPLEWRSAWGNQSLLGLWSKLFDPSLRPTSSRSVPVVQNRVLSWGATLLCDFTLMVFLCRIVPRATTRGDCDLAFSMLLPAVILMSPVAWDHYFVLLLLPVVLLWTTLPLNTISRWDIRLIGCLLWAAPGVWWNLFIPDFSSPHTSLSSTSWMTITVLSIPTYAVIGLFALGIATLQRSRVEGTETDVTLAVKVQPVPGNAP